MADFAGHLCPAARTRTGQGQDRPSGRGSRRTPGQRGCQAAADQHPVPRRGGGGPRPGVVAMALAAGAARAGLPRRARRHRGNGGDGRRAAGRERDAEVHRNPQHVALARLLAGLPELAAAAVDLIAGHPGERHARPGRGGDHRGGQRRLGGEPHPAGHARPRPPRPAPEPRLRQVQPEIERGVRAVRHVRREHHALAVLHLPGDPGVLAGDPHRGVPFFSSAVSSIARIAPGSPSRAVMNCCSAASPAFQSQRCSASRACIRRGERCPAASASCQHDLRSPGSASSAPM